MIGLTTKTWLLSFGEEMGEKLHDKKEGFVGRVFAEMVPERDERQLGMGQQEGSGEMRLAGEGQQQQRQALLGWPVLGVMSHQRACLRGREQGME